MGRKSRDRKKISRFRSVKKRNEFRNRNNVSRIDVEGTGGWSGSTHANPRYRGLDLLPLSRVVEQEKKRSA